MIYDYKRKNLLHYLCWRIRKCLLVLISKFGKQASTFLNYKPIKNIYIKKLFKKCGKQASNFLTLKK